MIVVNDNALKAPGQCSNDEGRAMAQLIYDLIPGVQIYFYTGFLFGNFAEAITALVEVGCDVIVDDIRKYQSLSVSYVLSCLLLILLLLL